MNKNITRGLALVALTGGFTILGTTAANAIDIGDGDGLLGLGLGGTTGDQILDDLRVPLDANVPVTVDGLNASVLPGDGVGSLGNGLFATTGDSQLAMFKALGINTDGALGTGENLTALVGVPVDVSNTWVSVLGNEPNGIVVVPNAHALPTADATDGAEGVLDAFIGAPVDVSCSSVAVLSNYQSDCDGTPGAGNGSGGLLGDGLLDGDILSGDVLGGEILDGDILDGDILDGDVTADGTTTVEDQQINILDGSTLGDAGIGGDGVLVDPADEGTDLGTGFDLGDPQRGTVGSPVDVSDTWVSVLGDNGGVVIVPDSSVSPFLTTLGLVDSDVIAPIAIDCVTVTVLSDFERACAASPTEPTEPTEPAEPTDPANPGDTGTLPNGDTGATDNGGNGGANDPCVADAATTTASTTNGGADLGLLGGAAAAGALTAIGALALGRKLRLL